MCVCVGGERGKGEGGSTEQIEKQGRIERKKEKEESEREGKRDKDKEREEEEKKEE